MDAMGKVRPTYAYARFFLSDPNLRGLFVTCSEVVGDLHLGYQRVTWKKLVPAILVMMAAGFLLG